jgi:entericidin B
MTRKILLTITIGLLACAAAACNTVRGAGEDLESVANDVDQAI